MIHADQETVDRWLTAGQWIELGSTPCPGTRTSCPPLTRAMCRYDGAAHPPADWMTGRRIAVAVPCPDTSCIGRCNPPGLITVACATVEWGPAPVVEHDDIDIGCYWGPLPCLTADPHGNWMIVREANSDGYRATLIDSPGLLSDLIGQWARGGRIGATA